MTHAIVAAGSPHARPAYRISPALSGCRPTRNAIRDPDLDLRHLRCPLPVLRTRKHLAGMASGDVVRVLCTDPLASLDIPHLVRETGNVLVAHAVDGPVHAFEIRKR